jgi:hypothetical protein
LMQTLQSGVINQSQQKRVIINFNDGHGINIFCRSFELIRFFMMILTSLKSGLKRTISQTSYPSIPGSIIFNKMRSGLY